MAAWTMCPFALVGNILAQHGGVIQFRFERVNNNWQLLIFDHNGLNAVIGDIAVISDDIGHFLSLKQYLTVSQNHLLVTGQRWHPMQAKGFQISCGQHRMHTWQRQCRFGID